MNTAVLRTELKLFRREPGALFWILFFPTLLLAVQTGGVGRVAPNVEGFPQVHGFLDFMLAGAMIQSTLLAGNSGGIALAVDIEMGFTDRLLAARMGAGPRLPDQRTRPLRASLHARASGPPGRRRGGRGRLLLDVRRRWRARVPDANRTQPYCLRRINRKRAVDC